MSVGLEEAIKYTTAVIRHATGTGTVSYGTDKKKAYFIDEARIIALERALTTLKAVHLSIELECPKFRQMFSEQLEKDKFIDDKTELHRYILESQQIDRDAREAYADHVEEYGKWIKED